METRRMASDQSTQGVNRREFLVGTFGALGVVAASPGQTLAQACGTTSANWTATPVTNPNSAPTSFPTVVTTNNAKLGYLMSYDQNPYHKSGIGTPTNEVYIAPDWQYRARKDLNLTTWPFRGKSVPIHRSLYVPYRVVDLDGKCSDEALVIGLSALRRAPTSAVTSWDALTTAN